MANTFIMQHRAGIFRSLFVLVCILIALYLRLDFYPNTYYSDEEIPIAVIKHMETHHSLDTNWARGIWRNPGDRWAFAYNQYNFSSYNSALYYLNQLFGVTENNINPVVFNRICSVVFQTLTLALVFYSIHYLIGIFGAISASLFFVFNPLLIVDAHYARPESFLILIVALALFFHLLAIKKIKDHHSQSSAFLWASAFLWGVACACKFSILPMMGLSMLHVFIATNITHHKNLTRILWLLSFLGGAFLLAPYLFIHGDKVFHGVLTLFKQYFNAESVSAVSFQRSDWLLPKYLLGYFGAAFWLALLISPLSENSFQKCLARALLVVVFFYILIFSLLSFFNESNLSHLAFIWCLLLAIATEVFIKRAREKTQHTKIIYALFAIIILATPALCSLKIRNQVYLPAATNAVQSSVDLFEQKLINKYPDTTIVDIRKHPEILQTESASSIILRTPWVPRNEYHQLNQELLKRHYVLQDDIKLPLSELPHSQLQSIHFPAAYRYYQRQPTL